MFFTGVCPSMGLGAGGGTPVPGSILGLWSQVLSQVSGSGPFLVGGGYPRMGMDNPPSQVKMGVPQHRGTPTAMDGVPSWPGQGVHPQAGLG